MSVHGFPLVQMFLWLICNRIVRLDLNGKLGNYYFLNVPSRKAASNLIIEIAYICQVYECVQTYANDAVNELYLEMAYVSIYINVCGSYLVMCVKT